MAAERAAGRLKDLEPIAELEALLEDGAGSRPTVRFPTGREGAFASGL